MKETKKEIADRLNIAEYMLDTYTDFKNMIVNEFDLEEEIAECDNDSEAELNTIFHKLHNINGITQYLNKKNTELDYEKFKLEQENKKLLEENKKLLEYKNKVKSKITELYNIDNHNWIVSDSSSEEEDCEEEDSDCECCCAGEEQKKVVKKVIVRKK